MKKLILEDKITDEIEYIDLKSIIPFSANTTNHPDGEHKLASITYIAQIETEIIIIYSSYLLENEIDSAIISSCPFHVDNNFISFTISSKIINSSLESYATDFNFELNKNDNNFYFKARRLKDNGEQDTVVFKCTSDMFASIKYIDNYIFEGSSSEYMLGLASISSINKEEPSEVVIVDRVDRVIAMAQIEKTDTCAVEFIIKHGEESYTILTTFSFGQSFNKKKFKGMNINKINNTFLKESDQYLQLFSEYAKFSNIDKEYLIIKAENKDKVEKLFLLDTTLRVELESMINNF